MSVSEEAPAQPAMPVEQVLPAETVAPARVGFGTSLMIVIQSLASLMLRFALAVPFFKSGLTKWEGFLTLAPSTIFLFENQFQLNIFGQTYPIPYPVIAAWAASIIEIVAPILLVFGLFTRLAALALLGMAAIIFLVYPDTWAQEQLPWGAMAAALVAYGAGEVSIDHFIWRGFRR